MTALRKTALLALPLLLGSADLARANDSSSEYAMGALHFLKDPDIAMQSEDLFISTDKIEITYTFLNKSAQAKTVQMAFPMPDVDGSGDREEIALPTENADNMFDYHVTADGQAVALHLDQKVFAHDVDQTKRLIAAHVPLLPSADAADKAVEALPKATKDEWVTLGLAQKDVSNQDGKETDTYSAAWILRSAFTWTQTFPAGKPVTLHQTYKPSVGGSAQTFIGDDNWRQNEYTPEYMKKYCIDNDIIRTIEQARAAKKAAYATFSEQRIAYILKTGANWAGPIGHFHLTIEKGDPKNLVSFCADGVKKTGPTRFEVEKTDFVPKTDLDILIFVPIG